MEYIGKAIYRRTEIRRVLLPLWSAWLLTAAGACCAAVYATAGTMSDGASSALLGGMMVGACSLVLTLCYYLFGDSHRPYSRELHAVLDPTFAYYAAEQLPQLEAALLGGDERAIDAVRRSARPELALVRYSDVGEQIFYSQIVRVEGRHYVPLTEIIVTQTEQTNNQKRRQK